MNADGTGVVGRHPAAFKGGPLSANAAPDSLVDTSLQDGTGTTDLIVGAYYQAVSTNVDAFVAGPTSAIRRPPAHGGRGLPRRQHDLPQLRRARYEVNPEIVPQLQVNISHKSADQGALADNPDSAGTVVYLSPGVTGTLGDHVQAFRVLQLPVASHLVEYQLAAAVDGLGRGQLRVLIFVSDTHCIRRLHSVRCDPAAVDADRRGARCRRMTACCHVAVVCRDQGRVGSRCEAELARRCVANDGGRQSGD